MNHEYHDSEINRNIPTEQFKHLPPSPPRRWKTRQQTQYNLLPRTVSNQVSKHFHEKWVTATEPNVDRTATLCHRWKTTAMRVIVLKVNETLFTEWDSAVTALCTPPSLILPPFMSRIRHYWPLASTNVTLQYSRARRNEVEHGK